jgi:hypothetical protein
VEAPDACRTNEEDDNGERDGLGFGGYRGPVGPHLFSYLISSLLLIATGFQEKNRRRKGKNLGGF